MSEVSTDSVGLRTSHERVGSFLLFLSFLLTLAFALSCGDSESSAAPAPTGLSGKVSNGAGLALANIKVYLVPTGNIDRTTITTANLINTTTRPAEAYDEPLEDAVRSKGTSMISAITDAEGNYSITDDIATGSYFIYATPVASDSSYLPGGSLCRVALSTDEFEGQAKNITLSGKAPATATYIGSTACLSCHADYAGFKSTAHKLGLSVPGAKGALQDRSQFPNFEDGSSTAVFKRQSTYSKGTILTVGDYDSTRGFDKFKVLEYETVLKTPASMTTSMANIYLWQDTSDDAYKITIVNLINPSDSNSPLTLTVKLTYGGTLYKQRYLVSMPDALAGVARQGVYPFLQFQGYPGISTGSDSHFNRGKNRWRDYHLDWWWNAGTDATIGTADDVLTAPAASKTFEANCASCHFNGFSNLAQNATTGEWLADAVNDVGGTYDIDGDGNRDEINIGCESCHGPGSAHQTSLSAADILTISNLTPSRANMVCGTCHDRATGIGSSASSDLQGKDMLFDSSNQLPKPGMSRAEVVSNHMTRPAPALTDVWTDGIHSKSHHQQYSDFIKSAHYRNERQLVTCYDCHDTHAKNVNQGQVEYAHNLRGDPSDPTSSLCMRCHAKEYTQHMQEKTGTQHAGMNTKCSDCHMPRTASSGAGLLGQKIYGTAAGSETAATTYVMGDISSHVFDFVDKLTVGVAGATPGSAMPEPYTNKCGSCHNVDDIKNKSPVASQKTQTRIEK